MGYLGEEKSPNNAGCQLDDAVRVLQVRTRESLKKTIIRMLSVKMFTYNIPNTAHVYV